MDKFLAISDASVLTDSNCISIAAACAIILSSKMHDSPPLRMCAFSHFAVDDLIKFEYQMLTKLEYFIVPLASPASFVRHLLHVGALDNDVGHQQELTLTREANIIIGYYWEGNESLIYSPSIIGFAALVIAFSKLNLQCRGWLDSLPDECFHRMSTTVSSNVLKRYPAMYPPPNNNGASACGTVADSLAFERVLITVDLCIRSMKAIPAICSYLTTPILRPQVLFFDVASSQEDEAEIAEVSAGAEGKINSPGLGRSNVPSPTGVVDCVEELEPDSPKQQAQVVHKQEQEQEDKEIAPVAILPPTHGSSNDVSKSLFYPQASAGCRVDVVGSYKRKRGESVVALLGRPKRKLNRNASVSSTTPFVVAGVVEATVM